MEDIKHPLTAYRKAKKITLETLGELLGVNKSTVLRWESGEVHIPIERLDNIERITGISWAELRPDIFNGFAAKKTEPAR
jgi:transcriptional regulator with XRE-family HTH domain